MNIKKIKAFGDSFTRGTDLADCNDTIPSQYTWPALMAKKFSVPYDCHAIGGQGNMLISNSVFQTYELSKLKNLNFYVINWTWFERFDYINVNDNIWHTIHPRDENLESHFFYRHIDNEIWNIIRNMHTILCTIHFLQSHNVNFFMTCLDDLLWSKNYDKNYIPIINSLQQQIQPYIHQLNRKNFYKWAKDQNFFMGLTGHPLEEAHREAASLWYQDFQIELSKNNFVNLDN